MAKTYRSVIASVISILAVLGIYYGSYLPFQKSTIYIGGYKSLPNARSLEDFNNYMNPSLDLYSPIGNEEVVGGYMNLVLTTINRRPPPPAQIVDILVGQSEKRMAPILSADKGFNYSQNILYLGLIYKVAAIETGNKVYYQKAIDTFQNGLRHSPNRPAFLYNLFDLYLATGDKANTLETGETIIKYWPNDESIKKALNSLR